LPSFSCITGNTSQWNDGLWPDVHNLGAIYRDGTSTTGVLAGNPIILV